MTSVPPPNEELAELAALLGDENVRSLVRTFLRDFPVSFRELSGGDRKNRYRIAHSLKSNSRLVGAHQLSQRMAALEARLQEENGADVDPQDLAAITQDFAAVEGPLKSFAGYDSTKPA